MHTHCLCLSFSAFLCIFIYKHRSNLSLAVDALAPFPSMLQKWKRNSSLSEITGKSGSPIFDFHLQGFEAGG